MLSMFQNNTFRFSLVLDLVNKPLSSLWFLFLNNS